MMIFFSSKCSCSLCVSELQVESEVSLTITSLFYFILFLNVFNFLIETRYTLELAYHESLRELSRPEVEVLYFLPKITQHNELNSTSDNFSIDTKFKLNKTSSTCPINCHLINEKNILNSFCWCVRARANTNLKLSESNFL